ncbi:MAG: hypothetical protein R3B46_03795 [Phycisphaerales bacterium]
MNLACESSPTPNSQTHGYLVADDFCNSNALKKTIDDAIGKTNATKFSSTTPAALPKDKQSTPGRTSSCGRSRYLLCNQVLTQAATCRG